MIDSAQEEEEMEERGAASFQRVVLSIMVRMLDWPWGDGGQKCPHGRGKNNVLE
jgi:hypothetical protein